MTSHDVDATKTEIDPVCGMKVSPTRAAGSSQHEGKTYYFCALHCKKKFDTNPYAFLKNSNGVIEEMPMKESVAVPVTVTIPVTGPAGTNQRSGQNFFLPQGAFEYFCPMDPDVRQATPGDCPRCGMALEALFPQTAANQQHADELQDMKRRFLVSLPFTIILLSITMPFMAGQSHLTVIAGIPRPYLELVLASVVLFYCGLPILKKGFDSIRTMQLNMFALLTLGSGISYLVSLMIMFLPGFGTGFNTDHLFFESSASIITLVLFGQWLELKARKRGKSALEDLIKLAPSLARKMTNGQATEVAVEEIIKGDRLQIVAGDKIPVDGRVIEGRSTINDSVLSGNAMPKTRSVGDKVYAGTINLDGTLEIEAESLGSETVFAHILSTLSKIQTSKSPSQELADTISAYFIPAVIAIAGVTFTLWFWLGGKEGFPDAILNSVSVLVIACPCALGLATPLAMSAAITRGARSGLLIKDAGAMENLASVSDFLLDKTGTLTQGKFELKEIILSEHCPSENHALDYAASLERLSKHPLAEGIRKAAASKNIGQLAVEESSTIPGAGIQGRIDGHIIMAGSNKFLSDKGIANSLLTSADTSLEPASVVYLAVDNRVFAKFLLTDPSRIEAPSIVSDLKNLKITPSIVSGDDGASVKALAKTLGIDEKNVFAELLPDGKVELIRKLQSEKKMVAMLGDGINDVAALTTANAGIAMSTGSDIALSAAPLSLMQTDLRAIIKAIRLSKLMMKTMKENLLLAFLYNIIAVICASGALAAFGIRLNPTIAAAAMSLSSISVIINSTKITNSRL